MLELSKISSLTKQEVNALNQENKIKILIVEDNIMNQKTLIHKLELLNKSDKYKNYKFNIHSETSGNDAIHVIYNLGYKPPLIIMDNEMQNGSGDQAVKAIRHFEDSQGGRKIKILRFSTDTKQPHFLDDAGEIAEDAILEKPLITENFKKIMEHFLDEIIISLKNQAQESKQKQENQQPQESRQAQEAKRTHENTISSSLFYLSHKRKHEDIVDKNIITANCNTLYNSKSCSVKHLHTEKPVASNEFKLDSRR